jgi:thioredoxin 2
MALTLDDSGVVMPCPSCGKPNRVRFERLHARPRCAACKQDMTPPSAPVEIRSERQFDTVISTASVPVLVDFWAPWCGPCRAVAPEVEKLAYAMRGQVLAVKVNTDVLPELGARFGVRSIPTLAMFSSGDEVDRVSGAIPAAEMVKLVDRAAQRGSR